MLDFRVSPREETLEDWLLLFFLFSAAGWAWEVLLTACTTGQWVNRGMLHGPWLPVYGVGGVLLAAVLGQIGGKGAALRAGAAIGGGVEYGTAWALERLYRQRWWNYAGWVGSIHGRVCLASLTGFAAAGWLAAWVSPAVLEWLGKRRSNVRTVVCRSVSVVYAWDWAASLISPNGGAGVSCPL